MLDNVQDMRRSVLVPVSVKLEPEVRERMKRLARSRDRSPHWLMREAILRYIEREEAREAFLQTAREAWEEYRDTGLHSTEQEVFDWLAAWGSESEPPCPACHE